MKKLLIPAVLYLAQMGMIPAAVAAPQQEGYGTKIYYAVCNNETIGQDPDYNIVFALMRDCNNEGE